VRLAGGFEHKHGVAAQSLLLDRVPRSLAPDFFIGCPKASKLFARRDAAPLQAVYCRKRERKPAFHVKDARPPGSPARHAESHAHKGAEVVDGIEVAKKQDLSGAAAATPWQAHQQVITALFLPKPDHLRTALLPFRGHEIAKVIHSRFIETRRFNSHEFFEQPQDFSVAPAKIA
jgi:hypothetical protein